MLQSLPVAHKLHFRKELYHFSGRETKFVQSRGVNIVRYLGAAPSARKLVIIREETVADEAQRQVC